MARKLYRSMQGQLVDMELLGQKHELAPAIGNIRVNARGDELGPGGKIVRKREEIMAEYYDHNPNAVKDETFVRPRPEAPVKVAEETVVKAEPTKRTSRTKNN